MANDKGIFVHLVAGGAGGTAGAVATCPLEVVKTRLQSSLGNSLASATTLHFDPHTIQSLPTLPASTQVKGQYSQ